MDNTVLYSVGGVATKLSVSRTFLRQLEIEGAIPQPYRLVGSDRRCYTAAQLEETRRVIAERRAASQARRSKRPEVRAA